MKNLIWNLFSKITSNRSQVSTPTINYSDLPIVPVDSRHDESGINLNDLMRIPADPIINKVQMLLKDELGIHLTEETTKSRTDLTSLLLHHLEIKKINEDSPDSGLYVIKEEGESLNKWSDGDAVEQMNKSQLFNDVIQEYKLALFKAPKTTNSFICLKDVSEKVVNSILKTIHKEKQDVLLLDCLNDAIRISNPELIKPVYHLVIYSLPLVISNLLLASDLPLQANFCLITYDLCLHEIVKMTNQMISNPPHVGPMLHFHTYLENLFPDLEPYKAYYKSFMPYVWKGLFLCKNGHKIVGIGMLKLTPMAVDLALESINPGQFNFVSILPRLQNTEIYSSTSTDLVLRPGATTDLTLRPNEPSAALYVLYKG